jgi:3-deoxy-D-manno-octulosonate 8-phosphate phosphatase (KDO 8-P phosphatase)
MTINAVRILITRRRSKLHDESKTHENRLLRTLALASRDAEIARPIQLILSDVDGVLTNGGIILDNAGVETKTFHVRDGLAIKLWQKAGLYFGLVTARNSQIVKIRAAELGISLLRQGFSDKLPAARELFTSLHLQPHEVCYIGDDLPDLPVMYEVGLSVAVADAATEVRDAATWVMKSQGGSGAVRELIERLLKAKSLWEDFVPRRANA